MVKLVFKPATGSTGPSSKTSKKKVVTLPEKKDITLKPFVGIVEESESTLSQPTKQKIYSDFQPKSTKDFIGLDICLFSINKWFNESTQGMVLIGPTGCGKTELIKHYSQEHGIDTLVLSDSTDTKKEVIKNIFLFMEFYQKADFFFKSNEVPKKKLIVLDQYQNGQNDSLTMTDLSFLISMGTTPLPKETQKWISKHTSLKTFNFKNVPKILIISGDAKGTRLSELKKNCEFCYINELPVYQMRNFTHWLFKQKDKSIPDKETIDLILEKCKSDKRLIMNTVLFGNDSITEYVKSLEIDTDINIYTFTDEMFSKSWPMDSQKIFKAYDNDGYLISGLVQENYLCYSNDIDSIAKSAEAISMGDYFYSKNHGEYSDNHCINGLILPSYYSRTDVKAIKGPVKSSILNNRYNIYLNNKKSFEDILYGTDLFIEDVFLIKKILKSDFIKSKSFNENQLNFLKNSLGSLNDSISALEGIYKHFSDFNFDNETLNSSIMELTNKMKNTTNLVSKNKLKSFIDYLNTLKINKPPTKELKNKIFTVKFKEVLNKLI